MLKVILSLIQIIYMYIHKGTYIHYIYINIYLLVSKTIEAEGGLKEKGEL